MKYKTLFSISYIELIFSSFLQPKIQNQLAIYLLHYIMDVT